LNRRPRKALIGDGTPSDGIYSRAGFKSKPQVTIVFGILWGSGVALHEDKDEVFFSPGLGHPYHSATAIAPVVGNLERAEIAIKLDGSV